MPNPDFDILRLALDVPVILLALTFHEFAHAWTALRFGDPTARAEGRISMNPLHHLDLAGTVAMFLFGFGWAKPVPVNIYFLRRQIRDFALIALAGPIANIIAALLFAIAFRLCVAAGIDGFPLNVTWAGVRLNLGLALFNLIPLPPLDGSRVAYYLLPPKPAAEYIRIEPYGVFILIALLLIDQYGGVFYPRFWFLANSLGRLFAGAAF